jgi:hypothetical protein
MLQAASSGRHFGSSSKKTPSTPAAAPTAAALLAEAPPAAAAAAASELKVDLLKDKDWKLPQWRNLQDADTALINLLVKAGNSDVLRTQLDRGIRRLVDLPLKDDDVEGFREGYKALRELGLEVQDGSKGDSGSRGDFAAALLKLLADAEGDAADACEAAHE